MALRTIADLPAINVDEILQRPDLMQNLAESLFEISYMEAAGQYNTYKSKHVKFKNLSAFMLQNIAQEDFDFYGYKIFYDGAGVMGQLNISGNVSVNVNMEPEDWQRY